MTFFDLMQAVQNDPLDVTVPARWAQGRASFGGLVAALAFGAMRDKAEPGRPVRSLAITFVGPMEAEVPARFEAEVLREGKAVSQMFCRVRQGGQTVAVVQGSFGAARDSAIAVEGEPAPAIKAPEDCQELPYLRGVTPEFTRYLAMRWGIGGMPFTNNPSREMGGWVRLRGDVPEAPLDEALLLALVDAWPPAVLPHLRSPVPGSSLTWTIEFVQPAPALSTLDWCLYRAEIDHARDGYGHISARLWSPAGELVALSRQTVAVFG